MRIAIVFYVMFHAIIHLIDSQSRTRTILAISQARWSRLTRRRLAARRARTQGLVSLLRVRVEKILRRDVRNSFADSGVSTRSHEQTTRFPHYLTSNLLFLNVLPPLASATGARSISGISKPQDLYWPRGSSDDIRS